jgi:hypothetical protein
MVDVYAFGQGNPGCLTVMTQITMDEIEKLDAMGLRGSAVWIAYKDICKSEINELKKRIATGEIEEQVKATRDWKMEHGGGKHQ